MKHSTFKMIAEEAGYELTSYSGRGMYGQECVGIELEGTASLWKLAVALERANQEILNREGVHDGEIPEPSTDSLGLGMIVYWPRIKWDITEESGTCKACDNKGYLEVTHEDSCEYIEACDECNAFTTGAMGDATDANQRARTKAKKDGYRLNKNGKILD